MKKDAYIQQVLELNNSIPDRHELHKAISPMLEKMANDKQFWDEVFEMNLSDKGFLNRKWTMYEIPFFYVYECDDFYIKVHLFTALESRETDILASAIHHHNNYLLTTYAAFGSGYETFLFEKEISFNEVTKETRLKISETFKQKDRRIHLVDSWTPHAVVNPETLSATLVFWSPDKKRASDKLRSNPVLKFFKTPLRKLIYLLGMDKKVGIAAQNTYQWYPHKDSFMGILEDEFFAPTRAQGGPEVDNYSVQTIFYFMQKMGYENAVFLKKLKANPDVPAYYQKWIDALLSRQPIPETYAKSQINVPAGRIKIEDVVRANKLANKL